MVLWLISVRSVWALYVFVVLFGFFYGGKVPILPGLVGSLFGTHSLAEIIGIIATSAGIGGMIGSVLGGYLYDKMGNYTLAFLLAFASYAVSIAFSLMLKQPDKPLTNY
ncbi:MAG: MFS transporter [Desulfobacteria bacterium]|jgi:MFS family permease